MSGVRLPGHSRAFKPTKPGTRRPAPPGPPGPSSSAPAAATPASGSIAVDRAPPFSQPAPLGNVPSSQPPALTASQHGDSIPPTLASQVPSYPPPAGARSGEPDASGQSWRGAELEDSADASTLAPSNTRAHIAPSASFRTPSLSPFPAREGSVTSNLNRPRSALLQAAAAHAASGPSKPSPGRISKKPRAATEETSQPPVAAEPNGAAGPGAMLPPDSSPTISTNGLPPTVSRSAPPPATTLRLADAGLPPSIAPAAVITNGTASPLAPASASAEAGPSRASRVHELAASLVDQLRQTPDPYASHMSPVEDLGVRRKRAPPGQGKARLAKLARDARKAEAEARKEERRAQGLPSVSPPPSKKRKLPRRFMGSSMAALNGEDVEFETEEEEAARLARKRGPYGSRGRAGTEYDLRRRENRHRTLHGKKDLESIVSMSHPELLDAHPDQMIGEMVDERVMTMRQLATVSAHEGRVSARGIVLQRHRKEESKRKRRETLRNREGEWRRRQLQRRKLRAEKNAERQRRREEMGRGGEGEEAIAMAISEDEDDSDETFELEPDRLTPPTSPESQAGDLPGEEGADGEEGEGGQGEELERDEEDEGEGAEESLFLDQEEAHGPRLRSRRAAQAANAGAATEQYSIEALRAAGLAVDDDQLHEGGEGDGDAANGGEDGDDEEGGDYEIRESDLGVDDFRDRQEERRRQVMQGEDGRVVEEENDETRMVNQSTWGKGRQGSKWTDEDTEMFYSALREVGENYSLIKAWFPGRTVYEIKRKAVRENKTNPGRVTEAVLNRRPMDKGFLIKSSGYDPSRPFDREESLFAEARQGLDKLRARASEAEGEEGDGLQMMDEDQAEEKSDDDEQDDKEDG